MKIWLGTPAPTGNEKWHEWYGGGWNEALPIGNGSLGAMVYGDPVTDILQLNEDTVWVGCGGRDRVNPLAKDNWRKVRDLIVEGKIREAEALTEKALYAIPDQQRNYDTCGYLFFNFSHKEYGDYRRELDLETAVAKVSFTENGNRFEREYFSSCPEQVIAMRQISLDGVRFNCKADTSHRDDNDYRLELCENGSAVYVNEPEGGCKYCLMITCDTDGCAIFSETGFDVYDATEMTVYITIRSDYYGNDITKWCFEKLESAISLGYELVKFRHIDDYKSYFDRASLELCGGDCSDIPTNERLKNADSDPVLAKMYFDFGRYLLISSSRPGTRPANLQGIWNKDHTPPWGSKYTININAEMNYWPACVTGLEDCEMPLLEHLKLMLPEGKRVAKEMYGLNGFCAHHNTDLFGDCAPQDRCMSASIWPMGAAWIATHIKSHFEFTGDQSFLREYFGILREICIFFTEYLFEHNGQLITGPSISPENTYIHPSGEQGNICVGPTMDSMIVRDVFELYLDSSYILGEQDWLSEKISDMIKKLPQPSIGKYGQIMEWAEDYDEVEPGHRHISHLWGLHPAAQLSYEKTPELMKAARVTLERRLSHGGGHTGWSRAWIINMWARLRDGEKAVENVEALLSRSTYPNFLDMHPPFQIDGNFGGAAGIAEMLLQSQNGVIVLLPALPKKWSSGRFSGFKARGNITVDAEWENGRIKFARLTSNIGSELRLLMPEDCELRLVGGNACLRLPAESTSQGSIARIGGEKGFTVEIIRI